MNAFENRQPQWASGEGLMKAVQFHYIIVLLVSNKNNEHLHCKYQYNKATSMYIIKSIYDNRQMTYNNFDLLQTRINVINILIYFTTG